MRCVFCLTLLASWMFAAGCAVAQEKKTGDGPDRASLEKYLRRNFNWPDDVKVNILPYKPSGIPGLLEAHVEVTGQGQKQETQFLVSSDGQYLLQGPALNLNADPFAAVRGKLHLADSPALGSPLAPVVIVEFSDLQCGFCKAMDSVLREVILPGYKDRVKVVLKHFPLTQIHPWAMPAALFGKCVQKRYGDAGFWLYDKWVFDNQSDISAERFKEKTLAFATENKMDGAQLVACMDQPDTKTAVQRDISEAASLGISGTPTLFINGRRVVGNQPVPQLKQIIDAELEYAQGKR